MSNYASYLENQLSLSNFKQQVAANNISNYNTPNFKATEVQDPSTSDFGQFLALKMDQANQLSGLNSNGVPQTYQDTTTETRPDGNNVDITQEMVNMIKTNSMYTNEVNAINQEFLLNKLAIGSGN
jgi:flagellar basal-body rod protein FlgB